MSQIKRADRTDISRKGFLSAMLAGASLLILPETSSAQELCETTAYSMDTAQHADLLWKRALEQAAVEGSPVFYDIECRPLIQTRAHVTGATQDKTIVYKGIVGITRGVAAYNATSNGNIDALYGANIEAGSGLQVQWCTHSYTIIDSGKTLAVSYSCSLYWPSNIISTTCHFYAEFWADGSGYLTGGPIA